MTEHKIKILVVDDEKGIRDFFKRYFSALGMEATEAETGDKAIELVQKQRFDLYFIDMRMPGMNGLETFRAIKQIHPEAISIMMTGYALEDMLEAAKKDGAYDIIHKPFDLGAIKKIIDTAMEDKAKKADPTPLNVLTIDDDESILRIFSDFFKTVDVSSSVAHSKDAAVALLKNKKFDLVFLDLVFKDCEGIEIYKEIKTVSPDTFVVLITAFPHLAEKIKDNIELAGCLFKPFDIKDIIPHLDKVKKAKKR